MNLGNGTEKEFIDYIWNYGCHVIHCYGNDEIRKSVHVDDGSSCHGLILFEINGKKATSKECADLITRYKRDIKLNQLIK